METFKSRNVISFESKFNVIPFILWSGTEIQLRELLRELNINERNIKTAMEEPSISPAKTLEYSHSQAFHFPNSWP